MSSCLPKNPQHRKQCKITCDRIKLLVKINKLLICLQNAQHWTFIVQPLPTHPVSDLQYSLTCMIIPVPVLSAFVDHSCCKCQFSSPVAAAEAWTPLTKLHIFWNVGRLISQMYLATLTLANDVVKLWPSFVKGLPDTAPCLAVSISVLYPFLYNYMHILMDFT